MDSLQKLSPYLAHLSLDILKFLEEQNITLFKKKIIIGFSGGTDSTALLLFFLAIRQRFHLELEAVHINHSLREEAEHEAALVQKICQKFSIPSTIYTIDVGKKAKEEKKGLEETGRKVRYACFQKKAEEIQGDYIAVAHHLNDLAEDMLMRLTRGVGLSHLMGMTAYDPKRKIIRPFLLTPRKDLENWVEEAQIPIAEDKSNLDLKFKRNRIRATILPLLEEENPAFLKQVKYLWLQSEKEKQYWVPYINELLTDKESFTEFNLSLLELRKKEETLRLRILAELIRRFNSQPDYESILKLNHAIMQNKGNMTFIFSNNLFLKIIKNNLLCNIIKHDYNIK